MNRRRVLHGLGAGLVALAGCVSGTDTSTPLPDSCPTSQDLDVEWPRDLDGAAVESFVESYEHVYYRDVVVEYEPDTELDAYELAGGVTDGPTAVGDGWTLAYSGSGGIYRPTLLFDATTAEPPQNADTVPIDELDDEPIVATLREAADTGDARLHVERDREAIDRYLAHLEAASEDFDGLSGRGDSDTLYVDVDGVTVELPVTASNFHGDYWWDAWYYVDENVVRRTTDEEADPRDGTVLECRGSR
jgi:hypothetical protein